MTDERGGRPVLACRRWLMQSAVAAVGGATVIGLRMKSAAAVIKISQQAVAYQDHPQGDKRCDKCVQFQPPNACKMVDGTISPQGSCRIFMPKHQAAKPPAPMHLTV